MAEMIVLLTMNVLKRLGNQDSRFRRTLNGNRKEDKAIVGNVDVIPRH